MVQFTAADYMWGRHPEFAPERVHVMGLGRIASCIIGVPNGTKRDSVRGLTAVPPSQPSFASIQSKVYWLIKDETSLGCYAGGQTAVREVRPKEKYAVRLPSSRPSGAVDPERAA